MIPVDDFFVCIERNYGITNCIKHLCLEKDLLLINTAVCYQGTDRCVLIIGKSDQGELNRDGRGALADADLAA